MKTIADYPPPEMYGPGLEIDCQCARCGSSIETEHCDMCDDGFDGHDCGEDCCPCAYPEPNVICQYCDGKGIFRRCLALVDWCEANPLPGRENMPRGKIEWYTTEAGNQ